MPSDFELGIYIVSRHNVNSLCVSRFIEVRDPLFSEKNPKSIHFARVKILDPFSFRLLYQLRITTYIYMITSMVCCGWQMGRARQWADHHSIHTGAPARDR